MKGEKHPINPFTRDLILNYKEEYIKLADADAKLISSGKELEVGKIVYASERLRERAKYLKVYNCDMDYITKLSKNGIILLAYVLKRIRVNKDTIMIDLEQAAEMYETKVRNLEQGVKDLIDNNIIARTTINDNIYYINVRCFYRGERRFLFLPENQY